MTALDPIGAAPESRRPRFIALLFAVSVTPIFWLGQLMLGYSITAQACYPGDHPIAAAQGPLFAALMAFDVVALLACATGSVVGWRSWRQADGPTRERELTRHRNEERNRFLALWALLSNGCFFGAILFNIIASLTVPPCPG